MMTSTERNATKEVAAALEALLARHSPRDGVMCSECGHLAPCFTNRTTSFVIRMLIVLEDE